jgi:hypothetical protein
MLTRRYGTFQRAGRFLGHDSALGAVSALDGHASESERFG